jgi:thioesterase domain-containing protein
MIQVLGKARKHSFDLQLPDFYNCQTIREQATLIHARTGETQLPQHEHLIRLTSGSHELPIYIIPGIHGACDGYQELADFFEGTYTVYGIQMQGLWEGEEPIGSVEEIAAQNIRWIKELQPKGPYRFIGHSFGGVVLYEMVRQLERSNDTVGLATILDVSPHSQENRISKADKAKTIVESVREYMLFHHLMEDANQEWLTSLEAELLALPDPDMLPYLNKAVEERFAGYRLIKGILKNIKLLTYNFLMTYFPQQVLETELLIGKAQEEPWGDIDNALGWAAYADKAIQFPIPGKHSDMIRKPHAQALADFVIQKLA